MNYIIKLWNALQYARGVAIWVAIAVMVIYCIKAHSIGFSHIVEIDLNEPEIEEAWGVDFTPGANISCEREWESERDYDSGSGDRGTCDWCN